MLYGIGVMLHTRVATLQDEVAILQSRVAFLHGDGRILLARVAMLPPERRC